MADNKLNESEWDMDLVINELKGLSEDLLDLTGFDKDLIIEPDEKDDEVPEVPKKPIDNHKACYPVSLPTKAILIMTKEKEIVADPFLGSGTTIIASEKTDRICYGMEIDPLYTDVIVERWCRYTGITDIKKNGIDYKWKL